MRYYFHFVSKDDEIPDVEGVDLPDLRAAHCHALRIIHQTAPFIPEGPDWRGWRIEVARERSENILTVLFPASPTASVHQAAMAS
jgi:hypothetical protein